MNAVIARSGDLSIRAMSDDDVDIAQLTMWLRDPQVLEWFEGRDQVYDEERVRREYGSKRLADEGVVPCFIEVEDRPVGFIQFVAIDMYWAEYGFDVRDDAADVWGIDLFIGRTDLWNTGIGTRAVALLVDHLVVEMRARRVVIDPRVANTRAIRCYEKVGFRKDKVLVAHETHEGRVWDNVLMVIEALDHPVGLTAHLARIDSVNPNLMVGAVGEGAIADAVAEWATKRGFEVHRLEVAPDRHNVVVLRRGTGGGRSLVFNAHLDTVGYADSSTARVRLADGCLVGRGVLDTKAGLAAALLAVASLDPNEIAGDVMVAAVADEEFASIGSEAFVSQWSADAAVVLEPTDMAVINEHRGIAVLEAMFVGRSAHTSAPHRGANAAHAAAVATSAVLLLDERWAAVAGSLGHSDNIGRPSVLVSGMHTAGETFTVPAACTVTIEIRTTGDEAAVQIADVMKTVRESVAGGAVSVSVSVVLERPPLRTAPDHPLVRAAVDAVAASSLRTTVTMAPYWTDAALHAFAGTPAIVIGPVGEGLHEDLEWVSTASIADCMRVLAKIATTWCGPAT
ncbi:MAG: hypothetical protein RLZZ623_1988 [Actinomycetota bacterium]